MYELLLISIYRSTSTLGGHDGDVVAIQFGTHNGMTIKQLHNVDEYSVQTFA
jgi:hypothetical protein